MVGASLAGVRAAAGLREAGFEGRVTLVGEEPHAPYDRPPLSKGVLSAKVDQSQLYLDLPEQVEMLLGVKATALDLARRRLRLVKERQADQELGFDALVVATGAEPRTLRALPEGPRVHYLRRLDQALALRQELAASSRLAVVGAGFIGLEVASSARALGLEVTVIEALPLPLEAVLGSQMGAWLARWHESKGVRLRLGVPVRGLRRAGGEVCAVELADGSAVEADLVVVGVGVAPCTSWLEGSGLDIDDGVVCDEGLRACAGGQPVEFVVAAGDVARWRHPQLGRQLRVEHWTNAADSGALASANLLRPAEPLPYCPVPYFWSDQHGAKLQFVGLREPGDELAVVDGDLDQERFVVAYGRHGRLVAALGVRRPSRVMALSRQIAEGAAFPPEL